MAGLTESSLTTVSGAELLQMTDGTRRGLSYKTAYGVIEAVHAAFKERPDQEITPLDPQDFQGRAPIVGKVALHDSRVAMLPDQIRDMIAPMTVVSFPKVA